MKRIRYTKYTGDPASEMSMEDMLKALSDICSIPVFRSAVAFLRAQWRAHHR